MEILVAKAIYGDEEKEAVMEVLDSGWLGNGARTETFQNLLANYIGVKHGIFVNSGSSALLLALKALNLPKDSEVITCAAGFPSTLNPIIHAGLTPVVVDCELDTFNIDIKLAKKALSSKTSAIIFAHAAGNPVDLDGLDYILRRVPSIEDNCDALGAEFDYKKTGSFGTLSACSFYASHHITAAGGGGMVFTDDTDLATKIFSMRDWGKFYDKPGFYQNNNTQLNVDIDGIAYDKNYSYQTIGFNMKELEIGAAFGIEQFKRLPSFIAARNNNFKEFYDRFEDISDFIKPRVYKGAKPSWFFYPLTLKRGNRDNMIKYLELNNIHTRLFFAGNIIRQPALKGSNIKVIGDLPNADKLMRDTLMLGIHPDIRISDINYVYQKIKDLL